MKALLQRRTLLLAAVVLSAAFSGGCSRLVQMYVRNNFAFPVYIHERTEWRDGSGMKDSGPIASQGLYGIAEMSRDEIAHLQAADAKGKVLSQVTVTAAMVNAAYWNHDDIIVGVGAGQNSVILGKSQLVNATNSWRTCGIVSAVLAGALIAFRFWQRRM